jgi:hypothetical protein
MNRRKFLTMGVAGAASAVALGGVTYLSITPADKSLLSIDAVLVAIDSINSKAIALTGAWTAAQVFNHMAQSVEYSMLGYPEHKSEFFKSTIGPLAFAAFSSKGKMRHNLSEAIPGAPALVADDNVSQTIARFRLSLINFDQYAGELKPHFAYGQLSKDQYALAHVMHFYDHMSELA